jgi:hypothetical protein
MTREELYQLIGHEDLFKDLDVKTLVLDLMKEKVTREELLTLLWRHLPDLDEAFVSGYCYRRY